MEIERTYLLRGLPRFPEGAIAASLRIEQGYFADSGDGAMEGRLRRTTLPDGLIRCTHTIKRGDGLVREEIEREISEAEFERHWPATEGRRLMKTRHVVPIGIFTWEIDEFIGLQLVLAEVELRSPDDQPPIPVWIQSEVIRDVTEEKAYRNFELAIRMGSAGEMP